jgi:hypothetical protein
MDNFSNIQISLVEPGVKYFIGNSLKQCRDFKNKYYNIFFNIGVFIVFTLLLGGFLMYKYKGNITPAEMEIKNRKKQEYIVSKLQNIARIRKDMSYKIITDLPNWEDHPELGILQKRPI